MDTIKISLPESMKEFIESEVAAGRYETPSAFICTLLSAAQKRSAKEKIDALLLEGLDGGEAREMTGQDWEDIRREVRERHPRRGGKKP